MKNLFLFLAFTALTTLEVLQAQSVTQPEFLEHRDGVWVDSVMNTLTLEEKIGQLIMVAAYSNRGDKHKKEILKLIEEQKIGGLIFFQGDPESQVKLMNEYQEASKVPLLGAIDAEWGLGMRLKNTISYPFQMALGAIQDDKLLYELGAEVAEQVKTTGLHINFAPVVDVNNNPANPVINFRSFGEDKYNVSGKAIAYMKGMQDHKVFTTAKHFPGHGDTDTDSHYALPQINQSVERLDSLELYPFRRIIEAGVGGVMVAHLNIPALDPTGVPSTLSKPIITALLKENLQFEGLIVTDAMNMKGVTKGNLPGVVDKDALLAGNDLLEFTEDVPRTIEEVKKAISEGLISRAAFDEKVRKVLAVKQWVGLNEYTETSDKRLEKKLNSPAAEELYERLVAASLTVLKNDQGLLPVKDLEPLKIASVSIGAKSRTEFQRTLGLYTRIEHFQLKAEADSSDIKELQEDLTEYDLVITGIHDDSKYPRNTMKFSLEVLQLISSLSNEENSIIAFFKNPYVLDQIDNIENAPGLIVAYQNSEMTEKKVAQLIFGGIGANGKLPVSVGGKFKSGDGLEVSGGYRLSYTLPEAAGMDSEVLSAGIDSLMQQAIEMKAIPGGQVLVAKDQKVVFYKAYGEHVYHDTIAVKKEDLYDLASVTKIAATMPVLMKLYDEDKFELDQTLANHLRDFRRSNKAEIPYRDILAHQGRLQPWIPFWKNTLRKNNSYRWWTIKKDSSARYPIKITDEMYLHRNYPKKIRKAIRKSPLQEEKKYVYSDFFFILAPEVIKNITNEDFDVYLRDKFYDPLGAKSLTFNPSNSFSATEIVPTENDFFFRHEPIHGTVHDEGAIMLNGVSGHAGLFSNANDLAKLLQMFLNGGEYGGKRYIREATVKEFTKVQFPENENRRALGFDKPYLEYQGVNSNTAKDASPASFGHTGFTGTMVWMDPEYNLLYIFLSNRVYPSRENKRLYQLNTRTQIQQVLYDAIAAHKEKQEAH
ncbi:glycoside hydrolase family 3 N-terminal domain-containing protein [Salinimicrobium flavum]|uniref:beta-N-acetylhexosaminidase n=1 Tax=Salinimicrobium flavum TaxID=1737065 RepID=A0ABW5IV80_9FLAO